MANSSDIIKIGFDYRSSLAQFEKETNGTFDKVRKTANGQRIELEIHASDKNVLNQIKELQKEYKNISLELDGKPLNQQIKTIDDLKKKLLEIIKLFSSGVDMSSIVNVENTSTQISKVENKLKDLNRRFNELSNNKLSTSISGKDIDLINNEEFNKLSTEVETLKTKLKELGNSFNLLKDGSVNSERFIELAGNVSNLTEQVKKLDSAIKELATNTESSSSNINNSNDFQSKWDKNVKAIQEYMDAVTKLNNLTISDKGTGKNANQIELQKKKIEELEKKAIEAKEALNTMANSNDVPTGTLEKWYEAMEKFDQATKGSAESVAKLEDALRNMKISQLDSIQSDIDGLQNKLNNYKSKPNDFNKSDAYKQNLKELENTIKTLTEAKERLARQDAINDKDIEEIQKLKSAAQEAVNTLKNMSATEKGSTEHSRMKEYDKIGEYIKKNTKMSREFRHELETLQYQLKNGGASVNVKDIDNQFLKLKERIREARQEGKSFIDIFKTKVIYSFVNQLAVYYLSFYDFIRYTRNAITTIKELDTALVDLQKTTTMSVSQLKDFYFESNKVAKQMGVSTKEIIEQASAWSRLGYSSNEAATKMSQLSSQFASISPGMDTEQAQSGLVSIMKANFYAFMYRNVHIEYI